MNDSRIVIFHTSDVHARTGFGARVASLVEPDSLLVDCGDSLRGSSTLYVRDEAVAREFAQAPYTAQAVGNREFHYIYGWFLARAQAMPMPMLCSNLIDLRGRPSPFARELRVNAGGAAVRLLAVLPPQYRTHSGWERLFGWRFLAPEDALGAMLGGRPAGEVSILLSHAGLDADRALAARFPELSAIIGGHTHETLRSPEVVSGVPIAHAGPFARYLGRIELGLAPGAAKAELRGFRLLPLLAQGGA